MFKSLSTRFMVLLLSMVLFISLLLGYLFYSLFIDAVNRMQQNHLVYVAQTEAKHIRELVGEQEALLQSIAMDENVLRYSQAYNDKQLFEFFSKYSHLFHTLTFVNAQGIEEFKVYDGLIQYWLTDVAKSRLFEDISWEPNKVFSNYRLDLFKEPALVLNTGFYRQNYFGVFEGAIIGLTDLSQYLRNYLEYRLGASGHLMLVDESGRVLLHPDPDLMYLNLINADNADDRLLLSALDMNPGFGRTSVFGKDSFVAFAPVGIHRWSLMAILPYGEFIAEPTRYFQLFLFLLLFITFIGILLALYLSLSITRPVLHLTESSNSIAMGDLSERVHIDRADEIGRLSAAFNVMAHSLQMSKNKLDTEAKLRDELILELEAKNAELERYSYTVSHDLKSPLVTVKGFIGLLRQDIISADQRRVDQDLDLIAEAVDRMALMLENLLDLSRVGHLINEPVKISLNELFEETIRVLQYRVDQVQAEVNIQPDMPFIHADRQRMQEVAQNLLENALKFHRPGIKPKIDINAKIHSGQVKCCVSDNGIGIPAKYQEQIFGLFERLDLSYEGTGIGLALIKRIIEVHGGRLSVFSSGEGEGATFCFTLPESDREN